MSGKKSPRILDDGTAHAKLGVTAEFVAPKQKRPQQPIATPNKRRAGTAKTNDQHMAQPDTATPNNLQMQQHDTASPNNFQQHDTPSPNDPTDRSWVAPLWRNHGTVASVDENKTVG